MEGFIDKCSIKEKEELDNYLSLAIFGGGLPLSIVSIYSNLRLSNLYEKGLKNDSEYQAEINDDIYLNNNGENNDNEDEEIDNDLDFNYNDYDYDDGDNYDDDFDEFINLEDSSNNQEFYEYV